MTRCLLDTSVLVRLANAADAAHLTAKLAVAALSGRGDEGVICPQCVIEFRSVATRPAGSANGLGLSAAAADLLITAFEQDHPLVPDTAAIYPAWRTLVAALGVEGKTVHDARLVAVCRAHGIDHILTFYARHFTRLAAFPPGLTVLHPAQV